ncbi:MAG: GNAT family N-acetyltransferase [Acholeplasmataceae bacterium]|nr:N-acetyltransferase [Acholeplasmataceae bacterium]
MKFIHEDHKIYVLDENQKEIVVATFPQFSEGVVNVDHTFVDPSLRGQGVASQLMHEVVAYAKSKNLKMVATCPYAVAWFKRHPEFNDMIDQDAQQHLDPQCRI